MQCIVVQPCATYVLNLRSGIEVSAVAGATCKFEMRSFVHLFQCIQFEYFATSWIGAYWSVKKPGFTCWFDARSHAGSTALFRAAEAGYEELVQLLIQAGAASCGAPQLVGGLMAGWRQPFWYSDGMNSIEDWNKPKPHTQRKNI